MKCGEKRGVCECAYGKDLRASRYYTTTYFLQKMVVLTYLDTQSTCKQCTLTPKRKAGDCFARCVASVCFHSDTQLET